MAGQGLSLQPEFKTTSGPSAASGLTQQEDIADLAGLSATGRTPASMTLRNKISACLHLLHERLLLLLVLFAGCPKLLALAL